MFGVVVWSSLWSSYVDENYCVYFQVFLCFSNANLSIFLWHPIFSLLSACFSQDFWCSFLYGFSYIRPHLICTWSIHMYFNICIFWISFNSINSIQSCSYLTYQWVVIRPDVCTKVRKFSECIALLNLLLIKMKSICLLTILSRLSWRDFQLYNF